MTKQIDAEMRAALSPRDIENLALLARIKINDDEKLQLVKEIESILSYVDQIKEASTVLTGENRIGAVSNVMRADESRILSAADRERLLAEVPDREGDYVAVKKIL